MVDADTGRMVRTHLGTLFLGVLTLTVLAAAAITFLSWTWGSVSRWRALRASATTSPSRSTYDDGDDYAAPKHGLMIPFVDPDKMQSVDSITFDRYREYNKLKNDYLKGNFVGTSDRDLVDQRILYGKYDDYAG